LGFKGNDSAECFFSAKPNPGAGIGHQMANWISGYWWSQYFNLSFAHINFSSEDWEFFLGFGTHEKTVFKLVKENGYRIVKLPLFNTDFESLELINKIITANKRAKTIFLVEQDQSFKEQYPLKEILQEKFYSAPARNYDKLFYDSKNLNVAIHVRRGDIMVENPNDNLKLRFQNNSYYINILDTINESIGNKRNIVFYLFSQGENNDFEEFQKYKNLIFCLDTSPIQSFLHMIYADILITSKSSFSYKPALLSKGLKLCPSGFWHDYPNEKDWIVVDECGSFELSKLTEYYE